ncbi:MAG: preprotein translocase subunit SecG [Christensenellales bacterium]
MEALYWIINIVLVLGALAVIGLVIMQKGVEGGGLGSVFGGSTDNFFGKNKGKTAGSKMKLYTKILGVAIGVLSVALCLIIKIA